jgi:hypothetical protein
MMTVRFATGFSVQYNTAGYVVRSTNYTDLYTKKDGDWVAQVPNEAIVEAVPCCRTYNAPDVQPWENVTAMSREMRTMKQAIAKLAKAIKK